MTKNRPLEIEKLFQVFIASNRQSPNGSSSDSGFRNASRGQRNTELKGRRPQTFVLRQTDLGFQLLSAWHISQVLFGTWFHSSISYLLPIPNYAFKISCRFHIQLSSHFFANPKLLDIFPRGIQLLFNSLHWSLFLWSILPSPWVHSLAQVGLEVLAEC